MSLKRLIIEEVSKLLAEDDQQDIYKNNPARKSLSDELYNLVTAPIPKETSPERDRMLYSRYENWIQRFKSFEKLATQQGGIAVDHYHCSLMSGYFQLMNYIDSEESEENKSKEIDILKNIIGEYGKCKIDSKFDQYLGHIKKMLQEGELEDFTKRLAELQGGSQTPTPSSKKQTEMTVKDWIEKTKPLRDTFYNLTTQDNPDEAKLRQELKKAISEWDAFHNKISGFTGTEQIVDKGGKKYLATPQDIIQFSSCIKSSAVITMLETDEESEGENLREFWNMVDNDFVKCRPFKKSGIFKLAPGYIGQAMNLIEKTIKNPSFSRENLSQEEKPFPPPAPSAPAVPAPPAEQVVTSSFKVGERVQWKKDPTLGCYKVMEIKGDKMILSANNQKFEAKQTSYEKCRS